MRGSPHSPAASSRESRLPGRTPGGAAPRRYTARSAWLSGGGGPGSGEAHSCAGAGMGEEKIKQYCITLCKELRQNGKSYEVKVLCQAGYREDISDSRWGMILGPQPIIL